jgi:MHS family proline/betaine transporter-like MFS transporter
MTDEDDVVRSKTQQESSDMNCRTNTDTWNDHSVLDVAVTDHSQGHSNILPSNHLHAAKASSLSRGLTSVEPVSSSNDDDSTDVTTGGVTTMLPQPPPLPISTWESDKWQTLASVAGNVLEWFDFAIFGYLSDILGEVFFPPSKTASSTADDHTTGTTKQQTLESFFVFGLAFLMRPIGGLLFGYIGDYYGRKKALVISIFTMAFPTFLMGTLPGYKRVGKWAIAFLILVRLLQGLSVGGQLVSSLVYLLENKDPNHWGFYGSFTMAAAIL